MNYIPPAHMRILPHVDLSEQGLRELEIWLRQRFKAAGYTPPTDFAAYKSSSGDVFSGGDPVASSTDTELTFALWYGVELLDLTDPHEPVIVTPGIYAFSTEVVCTDGEQAGEVAWTWLQLDQANNDLSVSSIWPMAAVGATNLVRTGLSAVGYMPEAAFMSVRVRHEHGSNLSFFQQTFVQRIT